MKKVLAISLALLGTALPVQAKEGADPYQWLEEVNGKKPLDWVKQRNHLTRKTLDHDPQFTTLRKDILTVLDSKERIPYVAKMGEFYYNFWTDADHPRGIWRRTSAAEYRKANPKWETVLDVDALGRNEKTNWVYKGANCRYPVYDRCLVKLSRGGADASIVREFDLASKSFVKDGFQLPEAKSRVEWIDRDAIYVGTDFGSGSMTDSGYPRQVKHWQRGTPLGEAKLVFEGQAKDLSVDANVWHTNGRRYELINYTHAYYNSEYLLNEAGKLHKIDVPLHAEIGFFGEQMLVQLRESWTVADKTWPGGSLLAIDFAAFREGKRDFVALFEPRDQVALSGYTATKNFLIIETLDNVKSRLTEWKFADGRWSSRAIDAPTFGSLGVQPVDSDLSDDYFLTHTDFLTPASLYQAQAGNDKRELLKRNPAFFNSTDLEIGQNQAVSRDGTKVPYFIVRRKDLKLDGSTPTLLYGYGGFEISLTPWYSAGAGKGWLEKGGVYVVANIRGGGEFGPAWHQAAKKENRQKAYDDFIAVAEDLIARKITSPKKLAAMGGSNGGLLAGVMLTQRPELFGAVLSSVPLLDMQRYNKLLAGASWMGEYGDPDDPKQWDFIQRYSPYHNVKPGVNYPKVLFTTSTRDDRVHPGHARKMVAKMLDQGHKNVWYYENIEGGHAGAADNRQRADLQALEYTFLWKMLN
ncbi:prolyl oligopeptidase family serine peptidase [Chitinimonas lacunae]|uniref:Prolyl oligopeptidase family protein n=1 Tax=Chitinimonas lacunae TaxID=1963018 RepID=A0ABV8MP90_9NEIS